MNFMYLRTPYEHFQSFTILIGIRNFITNIREDNRTDPYNKSSARRANNPFVCQLQVISANDVSRMLRKKQL